MAYLVESRIYLVHFDVRDRLAKNCISICEVTLFYLNSFYICHMRNSVRPFPAGFIFNKNESHLSNISTFSTYF